MPKKDFGSLIREEKNKMENLVKKTQEENRDFNENEEAVYNSCKEQIESYRKQEQRQKDIDEIDNSLNIPDVNNIIKPIISDNVKVIKNEPIWESRGHYFKAVINAAMPNPIIDQKLFLRDDNDILNATGMSIAVGGDGGFMVGAENESWLMQSIEESSEIISRITKIPIGPNKNGTSIPAVKQTSRANGSRWGGVRAYWATEAGTATASKPTFDRIDLKFEKLLAFCYMTEELMEDTRALEAFIYKAYGEEMGFVLDDAIINGTGTGKPLGILYSPGIVTVSKEIGQAAATVVAENVIKMWSRIGTRAKRRSVWLVNQEIMPELSTMVINVGTGGIPVWMPAGGVADRPYDTLLGRPIIPCEQCQALGTAGDIILCDLSDYIGIDKDKLQIDSSIHVQFLYDENCFRFRYRFNGAPYTRSALTPYKGTATTSPYVVLETRS